MYQSINDSVAISPVETSCIGGYVTLTMILSSSLSLKSSVGFCVGGGGYSLSQGYNV